MESVLGLVRHAGNDGLFRAIEMSLVATLSGQPLHLHAEGLRGTGKTTIMRAVRRILPRIRRIKSCLYNCDPAHPHCPGHRGLSAEAVAALGEEWIPMPFLEISHSAKVGTVVGSINLKELVNPTQPEAALLPGTIPQAHRGIIFVDEINRLAETSPELADVLLDVMGTKPGRVQIEETGLPSVEMPVQVSIWAASNPDEDPGPLEEIRRQLSDRFDFTVYTDRPGDASVVEQILSLTDNPGWQRPLSHLDEVKADAFRAKLAGRMATLRHVKVPQELRQQVADLYSRYSLESLRAVQAIQMGMRLAACLDGRDEAGPDDLARVTTLALRHRVDQEIMKKLTAHLTTLNPRHEAAPSPAGASPQPGRPRFPNISFGGAAVQPLPEAPAAATPEPTQWPTQFPPRPSADGEQQSGGSWISRTLAGLRRNLGKPGEGQQAGGLRRQGVTPPRPGRLFQEAEQLQQSGGTQATGAGGGQNAAGQARTSPGQSALRTPDPRQMPPQAPPHAARSLAQLSADQLVWTEEELDRR